MKIKTPVQVDNSSIVDADGLTVLGPCTILAEETKQAIIDAFEDAARFQFLMAAYVIGSAERHALQAAIDLGGMPDDGTSLTIAVDAARAALAK